MNFSKALRALKKGEIVARECWDGDIHLYLVSNDTVSFDREDGYELAIPACIYMSFQAGDPEKWYPNQEDILADDWYKAELED